MVAGEFAQAHGAAGVEFVGGDADLGAEAEFAAVGEAVGDIVENAGGVDRAQEAFGGGLVFGDDGVGVMRAVGVDVIDRLIDRVHDFDRKDEVEVFRVPVLIGGGDAITEDRAGFFD